jgi:hypothetical protein
MHTVIPRAEKHDFLATAVDMSNEHSFKPMEELFESDRPFLPSWTEPLEQANPTAMTLVDGRYVMRRRPEVAAANCSTAGPNPLTARHGESARLALPLLMSMPDEQSASDPVRAAAAGLRQELPAADAVWSGAE